MEIATAVVFADLWPREKGDLTNDMKPRQHFTRDAVICLAALCIAVVVAHPTAHWIAGTTFASAKVDDLQEFVNLSQLLLIGLFAVIIGSFVHRYPEPFFILWFFGWSAWFFLYLTRVLHLPELSEAFNALNTCFFLAAGADLILPRSWDHSLRRYPSPVTKRFGSPVRWLRDYYQNNPLALLLLAPVICVVLIRHWFPAIYQYPAGLLSVLSVTVLAYGLYHRMVVISPDTAFATLLFYAVYLEPQIARVVYPNAHGHDFDYVLTVSAPALILKPALALFVTLVALREKDERRDRAEREQLIAERHLIEARERLVEAERRGNAMQQTMIQNLPAACLLVKDGKIASSNTRASELLGLQGENEIELEAVFASSAECAQLLKQRQEDGRAHGYLLTKSRTSGTARSPESAKWVRVDAFDANPGASADSAREIVLLILDRHELGLTHVVFSFAHDYLLPRARFLDGTITQLIPPNGEHSSEEIRRQCSELLKGIALLKEEFHEYWETHPKPGEGAAIERCLEVAWATARRTCSVALRCNPQKNGPAVNLPPGTQSPTLSERSLTRSIQNVLMNAIEQTHKREKRPDLSPIEIDLSYADGWARIVIRDHGSGFGDGILCFLNDSASVAPKSVGIGLFGLKLTIAVGGGKISAGNTDRQGGGWVEIQIPASVAQTVIAQ